MHEHPDQTQPAAQPAAAAPSHGVDHDGGHSLLWMAACCAPMVLILVAIALGWFAVR